MPTAAKVEKDIEKAEGFKIRLRHLDGKDVRSDKVQNIKAYKKPGKMAKNSYSVGDWLKKRFKKQYAQFNADVLKADGTKVPANTKLAKVRDSYLPED